MSFKKILLPLVFLVAIIGCRPVTEIGTRPVPTPSQISNRQPTDLVAPGLSTREPLKGDTQMTQPAPTSPSTGLEILIEKAKEDLAQRLSISIDQIDFMEAKAITWPDASLGCPQPGMMYAQVQTAGYLIQLGANSGSYAYHTDANQLVVLCDENDLKPVQKPGDGKSDNPRMPIFLEVTQTTMMGDNSVQSPVIGVGPTIYFYNPENKVLMLHLTATLESTTEILIGANTILQTPFQVYEKREIIQFPPAQPDLIQISTFDATSGTLNLIYAGAPFNLSPGESRTFKQGSNSSGTPTIVTIVSNHGNLADIQEVSSDGSWR